jgi:hypothetical protein
MSSAYVGGSARELQKKYNFLQCFLLISLIDEQYQRISKEIVKRDIFNIKYLIFQELWRYWIILRFPTFSEGVAQVSS